MYLNSYSRANKKGSVLSRIATQRFLSKWHLTIKYSYLITIGMFISTSEKSNFVYVLLVSDVHQHIAF